MKKFTGDNGQSSLCNGKKMAKDNFVFKTLGDLDELTSFLGLAKNYIKDRKFKNWVGAAQKDIFWLSAELAGAKKEDRKKLIENLDVQLEFCQKNTADLKHFILPGASLASSCLDYSRSLCRRAERRVVALSRRQKINADIIVYLNHLSKFLFFFARIINKKSGIKELEIRH